MRRALIAAVILGVLAMCGVSTAAPSTAKRVTVMAPDYGKLRDPVRYPYEVTTTTTIPLTTTQPPTTTVLPPLGAPTNLKATISYSDYRGGTVNLSWSDNSSAETSFVLTEAVPGYDCRTWNDYDRLVLPPNTTSYQWVIPPGSYRGIGLLHAHGVAAAGGGPCPQDYKLIARNASGDSAASNVIVLDADSPNPVTNVSYHMRPDHLLEVRWRYTSKNYYMDANGVTCFAASSVSFCAAPCAWCAFVYARQGTEYVAVLDNPGAWGGSFPACVDMTVVVGSDPGPLPFYAKPSPVVSKCQGGPG